MFFAYPKISKLRQLPNKTRWSTTFAGFIGCGRVPHSFSIIYLHIYLRPWDLPFLLVEWKCLMCLFQIWGEDTHALRNKTKCLTFLSAQMRLTVTCNCLAVVGGAPSRCQSSSVESENLNFYDDNIMFNAFFPFLALPGLRLQVLLLMCTLVSVSGSLLLRL